MQINRLQYLKDFMESDTKKRSLIYKFCLFK